MTSVIETQKENATKTFYAVIGAPMVAGRKMKDFGSELFFSTTVADLETAGREVTGSIKESKVVEQIQEMKVVEQIQEKVDVDQFQEKVEVLREQLETTLNNWREQFTPGVAAPKPVKVPVEKAAPKKTAPKAAAKKTTPKAAAKKTTPKAAAKKTTANKTTSEN